MNNKIISAIILTVLITAVMLFLAYTKSSETGIMAGITLLIFIIILKCK